MRPTSWRLWVALLGLCLRRWALLTCPLLLLPQMPGVPIREACSAFSGQQKSPDNATLLRQVFSAASVFYNYTGSCNCQCIDIAQTGDSDLGIDGWGYQSCTQFVLPMASDGVNDMFEPMVSNE